MTQEHLLEQLKADRLIAIIRGVPTADIGWVAEALHEGGIRWLEVTFDQRGSGRDTLDAIAEVSSLALAGMVVGAGTVMTREQVRNAKNAGASFIISPDSNQEVIETTKSLSMISMPGALTPTEIAQSHRWGADIVKVFPGSVLGEAYFKAILAPLRHIPVAAVGGITVENTATFLQAGACCMGIGSSLTPRSVIQGKERDKLVALAGAFLKALP